MSIPPASALRPSVMQLAIKENCPRYAAYIPLFSEGGILFPPRATTTWVTMCTLTLPEDTQRYRGGLAAWSTPPALAVTRAQGVGISFPRKMKNRANCAHALKKLGTAVVWKPTQTPDRGAHGATGLRSPGPF